MSTESPSCEGSGHNIELKERYFGLENLEPGESPRPEIYLTPAETAWAKSLLENADAKRAALPLLVIHPIGSTVGKVLSPELWTRFTKQWREHFRIVQVGVEGQPAIEHCDLNFLAPRKRPFVRKLFALMNQADLFIGVDSGPMHIARAFRLPSLIAIAEAQPAEFFRQRKSTPYFLHQNYLNAFLYEDVSYLPASGDAEGLLRKMGEFASSNQTQRIKS
jgi:ADP-heptose:LPS heptosyltransferase